METKQLIELLKNHKYFNYLLAYNPRFIHLTGSRSFGITDERSDVDINIFVDDGTFDDGTPEYLLQYDDIKIHWNICTQKVIDEPTDSNKLMKLIGYSQFYFLEEEDILYVRDDVKPHLKEIIAKAKKVSLDYMEMFLEKSKGLIDAALKDDYEENTRSKMLYHICWISHILEGTAIDKEKCKILKRIRWQEVPQEILDYCTERLNWVIDNIYS